MHRAIRWTVVWALIFLLFGCGEKREDIVLALVEGKKLTDMDLHTFVSGIRQKTGVYRDALEDYRHYLNSMVDWQLMVLEARGQALDRTELFRKQLEAAKRERAVKVFLKREVADPLVVSEEEMRAYAKAHHLDRKVRARRIVVETEAEGHAILEVLKAGRGFEELARERSIDDSTRAKGGDLGRFFRKDQVFAPLAERVFAAPVGAVVGPTKIMSGDYEVTKVITEEFILFEELDRNKIHRSLLAQKFGLKKAALLEKLEEELHPRLSSEGLSLLMKYNAVSARVADSLYAVREIPLYEYKGGAITVADYADLLVTTTYYPSSADSADLVSFVQRTLLPSFLLWQAAHRARIDREQAMTDYLAHKSEELLLTALRQVEVLDRIKIAEDEVRREYAEHLHDRYSTRPAVRIREILVRTAEEAERLLQQIGSGTDLTTLVQSHTIRPEGPPNQGILRIYKLDRKRYGESLVNAAFGAQVGERVGPIQVKGGYSIFEVIEKLDAQPKPFDKVQRQARAFVRKKKENALFQALLSRLRDKFTWQLYEDRLEKVVEGWEVVEADTLRTEPAAVEMGE